MNKFQPNVPQIFIYSYKTFNCENLCPLDNYACMYILQYIYIRRSHLFSNFPAFNYVILSLLSLHLHLLLYIYGENKDRKYSSTLFFMARLLPSQLALLYFDQRRLVHDHLVLYAFVFTIAFFAPDVKFLAICQCRHRFPLHLHSLLYSSCVGILYLLKSDLSRGKVSLHVQTLGQ
jgi:hypothetical protein